MLTVTTEAVTPAMASPAPPAEMAKKMKKTESRKHNDLMRKQRSHPIPKAPKSTMTDDVVDYIREAGAAQSKADFAQTLAKMLREPKQYLMKGVVNNVPLEIIYDLVGKTIDIQSDGGMLLSEAAFEMKEMKGEESLQIIQPVTGEDKRKKSAGGVFLTLLKKHPQISAEQRKKVFRVENERKRQNRFTAALMTGLSIEGENTQSSTQDNIAATEVDLQMQ